MTISAKIIADSLSPDGVRLTTFQLRYHRYVHAELMTHRVFSRNSSSSRAIPASKMIAWVKEDPAIPIEWGKEQKGMQAKELLIGPVADEAQREWLVARDQMIVQTERLIQLGVHKQIANRLLEPWHHISVVLTSTQFNNWFALRDHEMAQPEIRELAHQMSELYYSNGSTGHFANTIRLNPGEWHLPYVSDLEQSMYKLEVCIKASVARCARVSHMNHDGTAPDMAKDIELHDKLAVQVPLHASPAEHQATPLSELESEQRLCGNFVRGWKQYRKTLENECVRGVNGMA